MTDDRVPGRGPSRRTIIAGALATGACRPGPVLPPPPGKPVVDAHVHLFNAADLPIAGFLKYVFLADSNPPGWALALIDFFSAFLKPFAMTAHNELRSTRLPAGETTPATFGEQAAAFVDQRLTPGDARAASDPALVASYSELCKALGVETGRGPLSTQGQGPGRVATLAPAFARAAEEAANGTRAAPFPAGPVVTASSVAPPDCPTEPHTNSIAQMIGWGFVMLQTRTSHLNRYVARFASSDRSPRRLAVLMVDYDHWLDDTPSPGSAPADQIAMMARLRTVARGKVDIRAFAGVDPLRLALERAAGATHTALFDTITAAFENREVHGFKLYPPMGFRATGNAELPDSEFAPAGEGRLTPLAAWRKLNQTRPLGEALDTALDEIYRYAAAKRVPIIAHAGPGNAAGRSPVTGSYGRRANPIYWEAVVAKHPIRLSLGHLVNDITPFLDAVKHGTPYDECVWSLHGSLRMLDRHQANPPDVYGDLAFMPELIGNPDLARCFFIKLREVFGKGDPDLTRILYGTDWIMLGKERGDTGFLRAIEDGMVAARYSPEQIENILVNNATRFLGDAPD